MFPMLLVLTICLLPNFSSTQGFGINLIKIPNEDRSQIVCSMALLRKYFNSGDTLSGSVLYVSLTSATIHIQKNLLDAMHTMPDVPWSIVIRDAKSAKLGTPDTAVLHEKPQSYFLVIENLEDEDLEDIFEDWKTTLNWNPLAQFVVYLASVEETDEEMTELMIEILLSFMNKKIYNVNVIGQNEENGYYYGKTVFPYHPDNNCGNRVISIETLDVCDYQDGRFAVSSVSNEDDDDGGGQEGEDDEEGVQEGDEAYDEENGAGDVGDEQAGGNDEDYDENKENDGGGQNDVGENDGGEDEGGEGVHNDEKEAGDEDEERTGGNNGDYDGNKENDGGAIEAGQNDESENEGAVGDQNGDRANEAGGKGESEARNDDGEKEDVDEDDDDGDENKKSDGGGSEGGQNEDGENDVGDENGEQAGGSDKGQNDECENQSTEGDQNCDKEKEAGDEGGEQADGNAANHDENKENDDNGNKGGQNNDVVKEGAKEDQNSDRENEADEKGESEAKNDDADDENGNGEEEVNESIGDKDVDQTEAIEANNPKDVESLSAEKDVLDDDENESERIDEEENEDKTEIKEPKTDDELNASVHDDSESIKSFPRRKHLRKQHKKRAMKKALKKRKIRRHKKTRLRRSTGEDDGGDDSTDSNKTSNDPEDQTSKPNLYLEEIYRALFFDKFPKDLSGCPLVAAFRPWEPYIFTEAIDAHGAEEDDDGLGMDTSENEMTNGNSLTENQVEENEPSNEEEESAADEYDSNNNNDDNDDDQEDTTDDSNFRDRAYDANSGESQMTGQSEKKLSGIEYQLLQTIAERLHISIDLQVENRNLYHLFQQLIDGDIEMIIGGIDEDPSISQFVSTTIPYHQDDLTWCVAKAKRTYNLFNFLSSFSPSTWLLTFVFALIATTSIATMKRTLKLRSKQLRNNFGIFFRVIGIVFGQSVPLVIFPAPIRLTFAMTFFMGLMFINAYQSFLISTLTTPQSSYQISRVEEIYQQRMQIMGSVDNVRHLSKPGAVFKYIREKFQMCYNIEECLLQASQNEKLAVAVSRQHSFYNPRIPRNQLYCFDRNENLYVYLVTMLLPKKFHLLHKINPVIQHVIESGHMQKWARDLDMRRLIIEERKRVLEDKFRSLTLGQIGGSFLFMSVLLTFALLIFILEFFVYRLATRRRRRTRLKIVKYLHRKFQQA